MSEESRKRCKGCLNHSPVDPTACPHRSLTHGNQYACEHRREYIPLEFAHRMKTVVESGSLFQCLRPKFREAINE